MNCPKCDYENKEGAQHCDLCKEIFHKEQSADNTSEDSAREKIINPVLSGNERNKKHLRKWKTAYWILCLLSIFPIFMIPGMPVITYKIIYPKLIVIVFIPCLLISMYKLKKLFRQAFLEILFLSLFIFAEMFAAWLINDDTRILLINRSPDHKNIITIYRVGISDSLIQAEVTYSYFPIFADVFYNLPTELHYVIWSKDSRFVSFWSKDGLIWGADLKLGRKLDLKREAYLVNAPDTFAVNKIDLIKWLLENGYRANDFLKDAIDKKDLNSLVDIISVGVYKKDYIAAVNFAQQRGYTEIVEILREKHWKYVEYYD